MTLRTNITNDTPLADVHPQLHNDTNVQVNQNTADIAAATTLLAAKANTSDLATVAKSGSYNDLVNKPVFSASLATSSDVVLNNPAQNEVLSFNFTTKKWENKAPSVKNTTLVFNVKDYGATGDGTTDDTIAIQAAFNAASTAKGTVYFPAATYLSGQLIWKADTNILGAGIGRSILKAKNALNNDLLITENFATETNVNYNGYTTMTKNFVRDISLTGNRANQTIQAAQAEAKSYHYLIKYYGWMPVFENVHFTDCEAALYTEYSNNQPHDPFENYELFEGRFIGLRGKNYARAGWTFRGPHDSHISDVKFSGGDSDLPDFHFLADNNGNYGGQGSFLDDVHVWGNTATSGYNAIIKVGLNGTLYAEGSTNSNVFIQTSGCDLKILLGYQDADNNTTADAGVILYGDSTATANQNKLQVTAYYGPLNGDLVRLHSNGGQVNNNTISTHINPGASIAGSEYKLVGGTSGNYLVSGQGQCGNVWDLTTYTGGNNTFLTEGRKYRGGSYSYFLTAFTGSYSAASDYVMVIIDAYPDWERLIIQNLPDSSDDGAITFTGNTRKRYLRALMPSRMAGYTIIAASDAPQAYLDAASYTCDGTADDVEINAAITAAYTGSGGKVLLSPGTFYLAATIALYQSTSVTTPTIKLEGSGMDATYLRPASGVHAISVGKATQGSITDMAFELDGASDGIHDIDGLVAGDGIGWRMRHSRLENLKWSGLTTHTGWGINIQPFRVIISNLEGNTGRGAYTYPANGVKLSARSTPNTGATFNAGDSIMQRVQITISGLVAGARAIWIDTDDSGATNYDASYFNQMVFQWIGLRSNVTGVGTGWQFGHAGANKVRSILILGTDCEQFGVAFDLYNTQNLTVESFYTGLVGNGGIYWRTDNTGTVNNTVNNWWRSGGTVGVFNTTQDVIIDLNSDGNNPNTYEKLFVETSGGTARINGSTSATLPAGVIVKDIRGVQRTGTRHPALNEPLQPQATISGLTTSLAAKQATLVSGTNIKTVNGTSLLGSGDLTIAGGTGSSSAPTLLVASSTASTKVKAIADYTCDGTADDVEIQNALNAIAATGGTVALTAGTFNLTSTLAVVSSKTVLRGEGRGVTKLVMGASFGDIAALQVKDSDSNAGTAKNLTVSTAIGNTSVTVSTTDAATFSAGQYVLIASTKSIDTEDTLKYAGELKLVTAVNTTTGVITLDDRINDVYTTAQSATITKVPMLTDITIQGLSLSSAASTSTLSSGFFLCRFIKNLIISQVEVGPAFYGTDISSCLNARVHNSYFHDIAVGGTSNVKYGIWVSSATENMVISDCHFRKMRHSVSIGSHEGTNWQGMVRNVVVANCTSELSDTGHFDTHEPGDGITFIGCTAIGGIIAQGTNVNGFQVRSRNTSIINCIVRNAPGNAILVFGAANNAIVDGNTIVGSYLNGSSVNGNGITLDSLGVSDVTITNNLIKDCDGSAISSGGASHRAIIRGNQILNSNAAYANPAILIGDSTGVVIENNTISGTNATNPIQSTGTSTGWTVRNNIYNCASNTNLLVGTNDTGTTTTPAASTTGIAKVTAQVASAATATATVSATYPGATTAGHTLLATVYSNVTNTAVTITGWTKLGGQDTSASASITLWSKVATGAETTITATGTGASSMHLVLAQYSGVDSATPLDTSVLATSGATSVNSLAIGPLTTAKSGELLYAAVGVAGTAASPAFTGGFTAQTSTSRALTGDQVGATATSYSTTASYTGTAARMVAVLVALKPTPTGDMVRSTYDPAGISQQLVGTTAAQAVTNKDLTSATNTFPTLNQNTTGTAATANALASATTTVNVNAAAAPSAGQVLVATSATAASWQQPYTTSSLALAPTGATAETLPRTELKSVFGSGIISGTFHVRAIYLPAGITINNLTMVNGGTAEVGGTHGWYALMDSSRVIKAVTADQTTNAWGTANASVTLPVTASYTTTYSGLYYIGVCVVATTMPTILGAGSLSNNAIMGLAPILMGNSSTAQTTPPTVGTTMTAITASSTFNFYAYTS